MPESYESVLEQVAMDDLPGVYAKVVSADFRVAAFFGGLEPAADIESRYFLGGAPGALGV